MRTKKILHLNLNYSHKNLSIAFRLTMAPLGVVFMALGVMGIIKNSLNDTWILIGSVANIMVGSVAVFLSSKYLPRFASKYFIVTPDDVRYKMSIFTKRRKFYWKKVEEIEINSTVMHVRLENEMTPRTIPLVVVSFDDFQLLNKTIVDICMEKDIDLK